MRGAAGKFLSRVLQGVIRSEVSRLVHSSTKLTNTQTVWRLRVYDPVYWSASHRHSLTLCASRMASFMYCRAQISCVRAAGNNEITTVLQLARLCVKFFRRKRKSWLRWQPLQKGSPGAAPPVIRLRPLIVPAGFAHMLAQFRGESLDWFVILVRN